MNDNLDDKTVVHRAIDVLRQRIQKTTKLEAEYYWSSEMTLESQRKFVDPLLYTAMQWLTDDKLFRTASECTELNVRSLSICCDITTHATKVWSPKHIGLAVHLHNDHGSRQLIEDMYSMG
jgi:hypothetical protein